VQGREDAPKRNELLGQFQELALGPQALTPSGTRNQTARKMSKSPAETILERVRAWLAAVSGLGMGRQDSSLKFTINFQN
jgi:hypothetical protein